MARISSRSRRAAAPRGAAILAIDPHLSWYGPSRYWEVRIHAGALEGSGVSRAGSPYLGLGHTRNLAWAMTTGGPDTADVYALELDEAGATLSLRRRVARPRAPRDDDRGARRRAASRDDPASHHGPLIARHGTEAWAAKIAYHDVADRVRGDLGAQLRRRLQGRRARDGAARALPAERDGGRHLGQHLLPANRARAEAAGGRRSVAAARRHHPATEWQGLHDASEHLQVLNPPQGFMQNCNIPPDAMMPGSPFHLDRTLPISLRQPRLRTAPRRLDQPARRARDRAARGRRLGDGRRGDGVHHRHPSVRRRPLDRGAACRRRACRRGVRLAAVLRGALDALSPGTARSSEVERRAGLRVLPRAAARRT